MVASRTRNDDTGIPQETNNKNDETTQIAI